MELDVLLLPLYNGKLCWCKFDHAAMVCFLSGFVPTLYYNCLNIVLLM